MMNMKKLMKPVLNVLIYIIAAGLISFPVAAVGDDCSTATPVITNNWYMAEHEADGEMDYWKFTSTVAGKGRLEIDLSSLANPSSVSWEIYRGNDCTNIIQENSCYAGSYCASNLFDITVGEIIKVMVFRLAETPYGISNYTFKLSTNPGTIQFKSQAYPVAENGGSVQVCASRTGGSTGAATVSYATANGSAIAGSDYTSKSGTLSWADGNASDKCINISIIDDITPENSESFTVKLTSAEGSTIATLGTPSTTTVTINGPNDSLANLRFLDANEAYNVKPGDTVNFTNRIENNGLVAAGPANHLIYLMVENYSYSNTAYDPKRDKIIGTFSSPTINPGGIYEFSIPVVIPANLAPGWDYLAAIELDYDNQVAETREKSSTSCDDNCSNYPLFGDPSAVAANLALRNNSPKSGDPVNTASGNFTESKQDIFLRGRGLDINFTRYYNSLGGLNSPIGHSWNHTYNMWIHVDTAEETQLIGTLTVVFGDGRRISFKPDGSVGYTPIAKGIYDKFVKNADGTYVLTQKDQIKYNFNTSRQLKSIVDRNGNTITLNYTGNNLTTIVDTVGRTVTLTYHPTTIAGLDRIKNIAGPERPAVTYGYDTDGNLTSVTDARGNTTYYAYATGHEDKHLLAKITDPRGHDRIRNFYGAANGTEDGHGYFVVRQLDADNKETRYVYNLATRITSVFGPGNLETKHYYDDQYRFIKEIDPMNGIAEFSFDANGNQDLVKDKLLYPTNFTYDAFGNFLTKTDPEGAVTYIEYNSFNDPTKKIEGYGTLNHTWNYEYYANGNLKKETDPEGGFVTYTYNAYGQVVTRTDQNLKVTQQFYEDSWGNLTRVVGPGPTSAATVYTYDAAGRRLSSRDGLLNLTQYTYDPNDNVLSIKDPLNNTTSFTYDANNNKWTTVNPRGKTTTYVYDVKDRLQQIQEPLGKTTTIAYDAYDRKKSVVDQWGNETAYGYDDMGNLTSVTKAKGEITQYGYDKNGNKISMTDADNRLWEFTYDKVNRPLCQKDPLLNITCNAYDPNNPRAWVKSVTDANIEVTAFTYDKTGRLLTVLDPENGQTVYTYDKAGNRLTEKDARLNTVHYEYDEQNHLTKITDRNNKETVLTYDSVNKTARMDGNLATTNYGYYKNGLLKTITYPAPYGTVSFIYDENGNRKSMIDSLGMTQYNYDDLDRLLSITDPYGKIVSYAYDAAVQRRTLTYPDAGKSVVYDYDPLGRLATVTDWLGYTTTYGYTNRGQINSVTNTKGTHLDYSYDIAGRLTGMTDKTSAGVVISSFQYTTLDPVGNRKNASVTLPLNPVFTNLTRNGDFDPENQVNSWGTGSYTYDYAGRQTAKAEGAVTTNYTFNLEDRLTNISDGTATYEYRYNGLGDRLARNVDGVQTRYVLDHSGDMTGVLMETDAADNATAYYIHGAGLLYKITPAGERFQYHYDPIGSTLALTDTNETMTDKYAYDPFGKLMNKTGSTANPFQYVGQFGVMNEDNGLLFMRARFYDLETKRFLSRDPVKGDDQNTQNMLYYVYSRNNPIRYYDAQGTNAVDTLGTLTIQIEKEIGKEFGKTGISNLPVDNSTINSAQQMNSAGQAFLSAFQAGLGQINPLFLRKIPGYLAKVGDPNCDLSNSPLRVLWAPDLAITFFIDMFMGNQMVSDFWLQASGYTELYEKPSADTSSSLESYQQSDKFTTYAVRDIDYDYIAPTKTPYIENNRKIRSIKYVPIKTSPKTFGTPLQASGSGR